MGGSVRIPASWCGVVGLKPSLGRIPMDVLPGLFDSISHHGPLARRADDARLFLRATQGPDDADILSIPGPLGLAEPLTTGVRGLRLGLSVDLGCWAVDPEIAAAVERAATALEGAGAIVDVVDPALTPADEAAWGQLWAVFMATYYGHLVAEHGPKMDADVLRLIELGNGMSAVAHKRIELHRTDMWRRLAPIFADHDALLCPTMSEPPWPAAKADRPTVPPPDEAGYHSPDMTAVFNLVAPCPAISVPCGHHERAPHAGLPIGLQIVGRRWRDDVVLRVARAVESFSLA
jgi:Asp-tRNA(Asn)/Glu-tRNA(Gln) amidotransferase A subunit family amidase